LLDHYVYSSENEIYHSESITINHDEYMISVF